MIPADDPRLWSRGFEEAPMPTTLLALMSAFLGCAPCLLALDAHLDDVGIERGPEQGPSAQNRITSLCFYTSGFL